MLEEKKDEIEGGAEVRFSRIYKSIQKGSFLVKFRRRLGIYLVSDASLKKTIERSNTYKKLRVRYSRILNSRIESSQQRAEENKRIWICWFQGHDQAPDIVKACINSINRNLSDYEIVILSHDNIDDYVTLPNYIDEKYRRGIISMAHYSDILRTELLCRHGGIWIDGTVLCTSPEFFNYIITLPLFVYKVIPPSNNWSSPIVASSWLIVSESNNKILLLTRKLLFAYWEHATSLDDYFLFHMFFTMAARRYHEDWENIPSFNNSSPHVLQFELDSPYNALRFNQILQMSSFHKLNHHKDFLQTNDSFYQYILNEFL